MMILDAIRKAEKNTSGEIRIYIETKNPLVNTLERAAEVFSNLKMSHTHHRNGVLIYLATVHREVALWGDEGIHEKLGKEYWEQEVKLMMHNFKNKSLALGLVKCIEDIGMALAEKFPYISSEDKNELPDEIVFGK